MLKPRRGGLFIVSGDLHPLFLFFGGARVTYERKAPVTRRGASQQMRARRRKQKERGVHRGSDYKQATPTGFEQMPQKLALSLTHYEATVAKGPVDSR